MICICLDLFTITLKFGATIPGIDRNLSVCQGKACRKTPEHFHCKSYCKCSFLDKLTSIWVICLGLDDNRLHWEVGICVFLCPNPCYLFFQRKMGFSLLDDWWNGFPVRKASWEVVAERRRRNWEISTCQFTCECCVHGKQQHHHHPPKSQGVWQDRSFWNTYNFPFQALLDLYLLESIEESHKHAIVSFLVVTAAGYSCFMTFFNLCSKHDARENISFRMKS